uniref:FTH domain-containing protein n=1 Tax=Caenorhabditis tropicalis TaxID=1561998 RepID=A0A1I7V121_9PELO
MKPLTYQCLQMVLQEMSFIKRKELYAKCPAIRKIEERLGYRVDKMLISQYPERCAIHFEKFIIIIDLEDETKKCCVTMTNNKTGITVKKSIDLEPEEAAERLVTYILNRPGTIIQHLHLLVTPVCILKLDHPMTVINLSMYVDSEIPEEKSSWLKTTVPVKHLETRTVFRDDTMKTARSVLIPENVEIDGKILSEWEANKIIIQSPFPLEQVVTYCTSIVKSGRPIGFRCQSIIEPQNMEIGTLDSLAGRLNARKTTWNGIKCVTIPLDNASELNVHGNLDNLSDRLIIEVNEKGTAINR